MRARISTKNVNYYLRQEYGLKSTEILFGDHRHTKFCKRVIEKVILEFTAYTFKDGKLATYNPYTSKYESLNITSLAHINSRETLMKELAMLHKARMKMLEKSRKKIVELSKKKDRTIDLEAKLDKKTEREKQLQLNKIPQENTQEIE